MTACSDCGRPRGLDLFCGAGGASMGYHRAGFCMTGVDNRPMPRYPFRFEQADAMAYPLDGYALISASPPCQDHSPLRAATGRVHGTGWMLAAMRARLEAARAAAWVIENVPGAPMRADYKLCACMFGLRAGRWMLARERWFETSWQGFDLRPPCYHDRPILTVAGHGAQGGHYETRAGRVPTQAERREAMGIDWMNRDELAQAIPPAYTEYIGTRYMADSMHTMDLRLWVPQRNLSLASLTGRTVIARQR